MPLEQAWPGFINTVAHMRQPTESFVALGQILREHVGTRLLTASVYDMQAGKSRRVYSEDEVAYPVGGLKPISPGKWTDTVLVRHQIFSSLRIEEIAEVFFDWELIKSLGNESNLNLPIVVGGEVIGTLNLLDRAGYYTAERVAAARDLVPFATIAFLAAHRAGATAPSEV
jgi:hypothetical protein